MDWDKMGQNGLWRLVVYQSESAKAGRSLVFLFSFLWSEHAIVVNTVLQQWPLLTLLNLEEGAG